MNYLHAAGKEENQSKLRFMNNDDREGDVNGSFLSLEIQRIDALDQPGKYRAALEGSSQVV